MAVPDSFRLIDDLGESDFRNLSVGEFNVTTNTLRGGTISFFLPSPRTVVAAISSLENLVGEVRLLSPDMDVPEDFTALGNSGGFFRLDSYTPDGIQNDESPTRWVLFTSGTTGLPKPIFHNLSGLSRQHKPTVSNSALVWGMLYEPTRMAGMQMLIHAMTVGARIVAPDRSWSLAEKLSFFLEHGVSAVSATPTMWRQMLQFDSFEKLKLLQATLGGEVADQKVLDSIQRTFPNARVSHVYASTEVGAGFSVHDGREGFPLTYLERPIHGVGISIDNGELLIGAKGQPDKLFRTGDLVQVVGDRVYFRGRKSGLVNIGGAKVAPEAVELVMREHDWVAEVKVSAQANPFSGQVIVAEVTLTSDAIRDEAPKVLRRWVKENAPKHYVPALITVVDRIEVNAAGKVVRK